MLNIIPAVRLDNGNYIASDAVMKELFAKNAAMPDVTEVRYSLKTKKNVAKRDADGKLVIGDNGKPVREDIPVDNPILTTVVTFADKSKVVVSNSSHDTVKIDPTTGLADECSKEIGLVYAIAKRILGTPHWTTSEVHGNGYGTKLRKLVKNAYDANAPVPVPEVKTAPAPKAKSKSPSLRSTVKDLQNTVNQLSDVVTKLANK